MFRYLVVAVTLLCFTGCATTMVPLTNFTPSRITSEVQVGERVVIGAIDGKVYDLTVTSMRADALYGTAQSGKRYKIPFESIQDITVERKSGWQAGTAFGGILTVGLIAFLLALLKGWDPGGGGESGSGGGSSD